MSWYAIFVKTGKEDIICKKISQLLKQAGFENEYELLVPKRRIQERHQGIFVEVTSIMFPGYILVKTNEIEEIFQRARNCITYIDS